MAERDPLSPPSAQPKREPQLVREPSRGTVALRIKRGSSRHTGGLRRDAAHRRGMVRVDPPHSQIGRSVCIDSRPSRPPR